VTDANQLLREDHRKVKELFREFEREEDKRRKLEIAKTAIQELEIHTKIEEDIYYPAVRMQSDDATTGLVAEAEEEHQVVERLARELKKMRSVNEEFEAKFKVMAENVKHHIEEEEMQMLPRAAEEGMDRLRELGEEMQLEKARLVAAANGRSNGRARTTSRAGRRTSARSTGRTTARGRAGTAPRTTTRRRTSTGTRSRSADSRSRSTSARAPSTGTRSRSDTSRASSTSSAGKTLAKSRKKTPRSSSAGRTLSRSQGKTSRSSSAGRTLSGRSTTTKSRTRATSRKR
jgi:hypothetical protein